MCSVRLDGNAFAFILGQTFEVDNDHGVFILGIHGLREKLII